MLSGEAGLSANARFLICGMRDNLKLLQMAVHNLFWRDDWQSNIVDVFRTEVDVVLAGQFLFRSKNPSAVNKILDVADCIDLPVIWPGMLENPRTLSISRSNF
jgi:hypothetical protein